MPTPAADNSAILANDLCRDCGICCDGILFTSVDVTAEEADRLADAGLGIVGDDRGKLRFYLSCARLGEKGCTLYADRPAKCQAYYCNLTRGVMNETVEYAQAQETVLETKRSSAWLMANAPEGAVELRAESKNPQNPAEVLPSKSIRELLTYCHLFLNQVASERTLAENEQAYVLAAFEHLKRIDRQFGKTRLLVKYAELVQALR